MESFRHELMSGPAGTSGGRERRREIRVPLGVAVGVSGYAKDGSTWSEMTRSHDLSVGGTSFQLKQPVSVGEVLHLSMPLPQRFRQFDLTEESYRVYAVVRDAGGGGGEGSRVGVMFLGKHPPAGYGTGCRLVISNEEIQLLRASEVPEGQSAAAPQQSSVRFERSAAFPECSQDRHAACVGWSPDASARTLRLCGCACHGS
jgi:hypothetical protein